MANKLEANIVALALIHGSPTFIVRIKYFKYKMETWPSAKSIITKIGTVGGVSLSLQIYPNGLNVKDKGNVSVSLVNSNDFKIQVDYTFKMKDKERSFSKVDFEPKKSWGCLDLYCHKDDANIGSDDDSKISCIIRCLKKDVSNISLASSIETTANELKRKYDSIETKIEEGNSSVEKRIARLESKLEASSESIKAKIDVSAVQNNNVVKTKCPICFEEMSFKIVQCLSGHQLCWPCKEKMGDKDCAFCDLPVNGRAFGMEAYLRTIFG